MGRNERQREGREIERELMEEFHQDGCNNSLKVLKLHLNMNLPA